MYSALGLKISGWLAKCRQLTQKTTLSKLPARGKGFELIGRRSQELGLASLTSRAAIFAVLTCSIPIVIIEGYFTHQTLGALTQAAVDKNNKVADRIAGDIGNYILNKKNFIMASSGKDEVRAMDPVTTKRYLQQIQPFYGSNDTLFVTDSIVTAISKVQQQADSITTQTQRQAGLCRQALEAVGGIHVIATQNSSSIQAIEAVSQEQSAAIQEITGSVEELKGLANDLEGMVRQFKV